jgi:hypothetical protein
MTARPPRFLYIRGCTMLELLGVLICLGLAALAMIFVSSFLGIAIGKVLVALSPLWRRFQRPSNGKPREPIFWPDPARNHPHRRS